MREEERAMPLLFTLRAILLLRFLLSILLLPSLRSIPLLVIPLLSLPYDCRRAPVILILLTGSPRNRLFAGAAQRLSRCEGC